MTGPSASRLRQIVTKLRDVPGWAVELKRQADELEARTSRRGGQR